MRFPRRKRHRDELQSLDLRHCPIQQIGYAWQVTTLLLRKADAAERLRLVATRQAYLDEMYRRDPVASREWVARALRGDLERPDVYLRRHNHTG